MKLLHAAFLFISLSLVQGLVMRGKDMLCPQFFVNKKSPVVFGEVMPAGCVFICQTQKKEPKSAKDFEYVTLYDTKNRIPVYSAYLYEKTSSKETKPLKGTIPWKIEPQLDGRKEPYMAKSENVGASGEHQALNKDYDKNGLGLEKGHLYPANHAHTPEALEATYTLTNAAPQLHEFNQKWYNEVEMAVSKELEKCTPGNAYVVTGVIPGKGTLKDRVNVPFQFWTAYCCPRDKLSGSYLMSLELSLESFSIGDFQGYSDILPFGGGCVF